MPISSYLLTPPRSLEQVLADLGRAPPDSSNLRHDNSNIPPDAERDAEISSPRRRNRWDLSRQNRPAPTAPT